MNDQTSKQGGDRGEGAAAGRTYPVLANSGRRPVHPISFVVIRYSDEYQHNFLHSDCLRFAEYEIVEVDNRANLFFANLTAAILDGVRRAKHELIAVIHEDVLLPEGWQESFDSALDALESHDPSWALLGAAGCDAKGDWVGHWSDPSRYFDRLGTMPFQEVARLDEHLLIFHRSRMPIFDPDLPGIHHLGRDILRSMRERGWRSYVINAPTIHKYADASGRPIHSREQSPKIVDRQSRTYLADRAFCNEYLKHKWPDIDIPDYSPPRLALPELPPRLLESLDRPVVLLARGGSGSRLLSVLAQDAGLFLGNEVNVSGDSMELVPAIYQGVIEKHLGSAQWQRDRIVPRLRRAAADMLLRWNGAGPWGFKLPEALLLLPEIEQAFPRARYLHMVRDPLATCLRRTHMTARLDNHIGRITLPLAYDAYGRPRRAALSDSPALHMAYTTLHQLELAERFLANLDATHRHELRLEALAADPTSCVSSLCHWLQTKRARTELEDTIDPDRLQNPATLYESETRASVEAVLQPLRHRLGYR